MLLESGLVEGTGGVLCPRSIYTTKQDRAERMLDLQELVKVTLCLSNFMLQSHLTYCNTDQSLRTLCICSC